MPTIPMGPMGPYQHFTIHQPKKECRSKSGKKNSKKHNKVGRLLHCMVFLFGMASLQRPILIVFRYVASVRRRQKNEIELTVLWECIE